MVQFIIEGGALMFPILVLGVLAVVSATRYLIDGEPVRLRFLTLLALALLVTTALAVVLDVSMVMAGLTTSRPEHVRVLLAQGLRESSRPAILGLGALGLALDLVLIGAYRVGRRELRAARG
jgi:hypothetical protein